MFNPIFRDDTKLTEIETDLAAILKPSRMRHTQGVRYTAAALAMAHGVDLWKAELAGLLHDCAKSESEASMLAICRAKGVALRPIEEKSPDLLHAKVGAIFAKTIFGVDDEDILQAIEDHTTGRAGMSKLSQIVYLADFIEPGRTMCSRLPEIRQMAFEDLDRCCYTVLKEIANYLAARGIEADPRAEEAIVYYENLLRNA